MTNTYYTNTFRATPFFLIPSAAHNNQWTLAEQGFDAVHVAVTAINTEIDAARQGDTALLTRLLKYIVATTGLTANLPANNFRITGLPTPVLASEPATKGYADGLSFSGALPDQAGNAGLSIVTNGTTASWGTTAAGCIAIMNFIGY